MTQTVLTLLPVSALLLISLSHGLGRSASSARGAVMAPQRDRPLITLTPQRIKLQVGSPPRTLTGQASLTLLEAYTDDSLRAIVAVTIDDAERIRLAKIVAVPGGTATTSPPASAIPAVVGRQEVRVRWRRGTSCPDAEIELPALTLTAAGLQFATSPSRFRIEIPLVTIDTLPQLLCSWTRQINARRPRAGVIMAINRLLIPDTQ